MAQAISQLNSSESSEFGLYLSDLVGFRQSYPRERNIKNNEIELIQRYQNKVIKKALQSYDWNKFARYIKVQKTKENKITVYVDGPDSIVESAQLLEYGTPNKPADPLLRTTEAELNSDFELKRMHSL